MNKRLLLIAFLEMSVGLIQAALHLLIGIDEILLSSGLIMFGFGLFLPTFSENRNGLR